MFVKIGNNLIELEGAKDETLLSFLLKNNIPVKAECGTNKKCGKCKVITSNKVSYSEEELKFLTRDEVEAGTILACFHKCSEVDEVVIPQEERPMKILDNFYLQNNEGHNKYVVTSIRIPEITLDNNQNSIVSMICNTLGKRYEFTLETLKKLSHMDEFSNLSLLIKEDKIIIDASINKDDLKAYGFAVDIGSTTLVSLLIDLLRQEIVDKKSFTNPQVNFGSDIISRIQYDQADTSGMMNKILIEKIRDSFKDLSQSNDISASNIVESVIAGNTTMIYFLLGMNPHKISYSPFVTVDTDKRTFSYMELFADLSFKFPVTVLPGVSAYIGSDILSGLLHCKVFCSNKNILFIDIGTNGEMAFRSKGKQIFCTSTAAGPAFEGANIKNGIAGIEGAISKVKITGNCVFYETIGNKEPIGICGSGIVDTISQLIQIGEIDVTGKLVNKEWVQIFEKIGIYQEDIREIQLAKSAVASGIDTLLMEAGVSLDDIDEVYLAGGFANNLDIQSAITIGLIPKSLQNKIKNMGNTSLGGCVNYLLNNLSNLSLSEIKSNIKYFEVSSNNNFSENFISNIFFDV